MYWGCRYLHHIEVQEGTAIDWLVLLCFAVIGYSDWKRRVIPDALLAIIVILALATRTRIDFYEHLAIGTAASLVGFVLYKVGHWSAGDVKLAGVVGIAFGIWTPYVALWTALIILGYAIVKKRTTGLPLGISVAVGAGIMTIVTAF